MGWGYTPGPNDPLEIPTGGVKSDFDHPVNYTLRNGILASLVIFFSLSTICTLLRVIGRAFVARLFGWDDALAAVAMVLNIGLTVTMVGLVEVGLAVNPINIRYSDFMEQYFEGWILWNSLFTLFLYFTFAFIKLSILAFYLRLCAPSQKKTRIGIWVLIAIVLGILIGTTAWLFKFCDPPLKLFEPYVQGECDVDATLFMVQIALQIVSDVLILVPPIPIVWRLNLSTKKKLGVIALLSVGLFVTSVGIARLVISIDNLDIPNIAINNRYLPTYLCVYEINCSIIAACIPSLAQLWFRLREWQDTRASGAKSPYYNSKFSSLVSRSSGRPRNTSGQSGRSRGRRGGTLTDILAESDIELAHETPPASRHGSRGDADRDGRSTGDGEKEKMTPAEETTEVPVWPEPVLVHNDSDATADERKTPTPHGWVLHRDGFSRVSIPSRSDHQSWT